MAPNFARAQRTAAIVTREAALPDAPERQSAPPRQSSEAQAGTGGISGTVLDINDGAVQHATVTLVEENHTPDRVVISDSAGHFDFSGLPAGKFKVTITAAGLRTFVSNEIILHPGERHEVPQFGLPLASADVDVQVTVTQVEIAQEQIKEQEQQRAFGVFPNFYSSYIWDAAPMSNKQKFGLATKSITDPVVFAATGVAAGIEQARNTFPAYGQGLQGYTKRYFADYADEVSNRMFSSAIYPTIFNQDPRYFYKGSGSKRSRALYAVSRAVITRGDNGQSQPNYSSVLGSFTAGALSNAYHQGDDRGVGLTLRNGFIAIGGRAGDNLLREFLFRKITPKVPAYATGKPATAEKP